VLFMHDRMQFPFVSIAVCYTRLLCRQLCRHLAGCCNPDRHGVPCCAVCCRNFSAREEARCDCDTLQEVLASLPGARRMVVSRQSWCCWHSCSPLHLLYPLCQDAVTC
jgi:hypothetical protein